jgi:hypothetical protein
VAGLTGKMLSTAFGQGFAWHHFGTRDGGMFGGPLTPAQIDEITRCLNKNCYVYDRAVAPSSPSLCLFIHATECKVARLPAEFANAGLGKHHHELHRSYK